VSRMHWTIYVNQDDNTVLVPPGSEDEFANGDTLEDFTYANIKEAIDDLYTAIIQPDILPGEPVEVTFVFTYAPYEGRKS
jgi:hypothetical protein